MTYRNKYGRVAKFGFDAKLLAEYIDSQRTKEVGNNKRGGPRWFYLYNGHRLDDYAQRTLRAWRNGEREHATLETADEVLTKLEMSITSFELWAEARGKQAIKRGRT